MNENTNIDNVCINCMLEKESNGICEYCGFDEQKYTTRPYYLIPRTILNGKYLIGKVIGEGGFGITYVGVDIASNNKIAIKEYYPYGFVTRENTTTSNVTVFTGEKGDFFYHGREKFLNEAKTLSQFSSMSSIVTVLDFFYENLTAYIVMDFIEGETFKEYLLKMGNRLPSEQVFFMMKPVMQSLQYIHKRGIIHRDISPDNIMITKEGELKLIDFGTARNFMNNIDDAKRSQSITLKKGYTPEEQYRSRGVQGEFTDVYALCATMYRAITGQVPQESTERMVNDKLQRPSALGIDIVPYKEDALMQGLNVIASQRLQNFEYLIEIFYNYNQPTKPVEQPVKEEKFIPHKQKISINIIAIIIISVIILTATILLISNKNNDLTLLAFSIYKSIYKLNIT